MTQKKNEVKPDASANDKEIKVNNDWIIEYYDKNSYMLSNKDVYIHGDEILFYSKSTKNAWLNIYNDGRYTAAIWINTPHYIRKIKKFIKEMKVIQ